MAKALEIFLDPVARTAVEDLWARLDSAGLASMATVSHRRHQPHITLINTQTMSVTPTLLEVSATLLSCELRMDVLGVFPGPESALFLGVCATRPLLDAHAAVHEAVTEERTHGWEYYRPGSWVPHCSLALGLEGAAVGRAFSLLHPFAGLPARVAEIGIVDTDTGDALSLAR